MNADERITLIREKIDRSKKHLDDLAIARDRFFDLKPYVIESRRDPQTGFDIFNVNAIKNPPHEIGLIAGDVIHNLRSALDHLAFQLVIANNRVPDKHTCFPIFDDGPTYNANRARRVRGMAQAAIDAIDAAKPYEGGMNELWCLHRLDIADKHHSLLVTLVSVTAMAMLVPGWLKRGDRVPLFSLPNFQTPLKDGDVFFTCEPGTEDNVNFAFDVGLVEPEIIRGKPLLRILQKLIDDVEDLVLRFKPLLV